MDDYENQEFISYIIFYGDSVYISSGKPLFEIQA